MQIILQYPTMIQNKKNISTQNIQLRKPNFFLIDKISNEYFTNHNKKYYLYPIKCDFKLIFNNDFSLHIETDF